MKRILSAVIIILTIAALFTGCGKRDRILYQDGLSKYVTLGEYKGIKVDTKSDDFKKMYDNVISQDVSDNDLYVTKKEGTVAKGDTANIDYVGKKDGVAFDGGTASDYDLEIGSGSFIEGFEDGLIGKKIGDTVDLNLTFPEEYQSADLAGKAVVFTVKINYVKTTEARKPEDYFKELKFSTLEKYTEDVTKRATENYLLDKIIEASKVKSYPEKDIDTIYNAYKNMLSQNLQSQYGVDFDTYLSTVGQTEADFKKSILSEQIEPMMKEQMVLYALVDNEKIEVTDKETKKQIDRLVNEYSSSSVTADTLKDFYGEYYFEYLAVNDLAVDYLYKNAKIS